MLNTRYMQQFSQQYKDILFEKFEHPVHVHDCTSCIYLGSCKFSINASWEDLYVHVGLNKHDHTVISRFGSDGEYASGLFSSYGSNPKLTLARQLAMAHGHLKWDDERVKEALLYVQETANASAEEVLLKQVVLAEIFNNTTISNCPEYAAAKLVYNEVYLPGINKETGEFTVNMFDHPVSAELKAKIGTLVFTSETLESCKTYQDTFSVAKDKTQRIILLARNFFGKTSYNKTVLEFLCQQACSDLFCLKTVNKS